MTRAQKSDLSETEAIRAAAMRQIAHLPDPVWTLRQMSNDEVKLLSKAYEHRSIGWRVSLEAAPALRRYGLVEAGYGNCGLTAYGLTVLRALREGALQ